MKTKRVKYENAIAIIKLDNGPAKATIYVFFPFLNFNLQEQLAQPNLMIKIAKVPNRSRCFNGFSVNLPSLFAVSSPSLDAASAWLNS